jgi:hypothetical protein
LEEAEEEKNKSLVWSIYWRRLKKRSSLLDDLLMDSLMKKEEEELPMVRPLPLPMKC